MEDLLFAIIAMAAVTAFVFGVLSGIWPSLVLGLLIAAGVLWIARSVR